ncbi:MAG: lysozyme [Bauldia sp.]
MRRIRARASGAVIWIVPANDTAASVLAVAAEHDDRTVPFAPGRDGIHPRSYAALARDVRAVLAAIEPPQAATDITRSKTMQTSPAGIAEIIAHEAIVPYRYRDSVGVDTLGVGHTAGAGDPDPASIRFGEELPLERVLAIFRADLAAYERRVSRAVKVGLAQHEVDALVSFDFNTGGILRAKLTARLNAGAPRAEVAAGFDGWHQPPEIIPRRDREKALFATGAYSGGGKANVYPADKRGRVLWSKGRRIDIMPTVLSLVAANAADRDARRDTNAAGAAAGGGAVAGAAAPVTAPEPAATVPAIPAEPALGLDPGSSLRTILIVIACLAIAAAVAFGLRALRRRHTARDETRIAAARLSAAIAAGASDATPHPTARGA